MINFFKNIIIKKVVRRFEDKPLKNLNIKKFFFLKDSPKYSFCTFGTKNPKKFFYVIKVHNGGGGIFSNLLFVLNHLKFCDQFKFIPVIDMENFNTRYNQINSIHKNKNSWEYYYEKVSNYNLKDVYKSKNVLITHGSFYPTMAKSYKEDPELQKIFHKYIKIKKIFYKNIFSFYRKNFYRKKVLGVHFRGTSMKIIPNHPFPPTPKQIFYMVDQVLKKYKFNKIFLVTDELQYLKMFQKKYGNLVCFRNSFRSNQYKIFHLKPRKNHRYELGVDSLEEMLLLSKLKYIICSRSNVSELAIMTAKNRINYFEIQNGFNSSRIMPSQFLWYLKKTLPKFLGGFQNNINVEFSKKFFKC